MNCPHCASAATTRRQARTTLGYRRFNCRSCKRRFNERTGTPFNHLQVPTDVVLLAVLWRLRYKLSFRDVAEMLLQRGVEVTHETIREWEFRFAPTARRPAPRQATSPSRRVLVPRRDVREGRWALVLPLPSDRRRRRTDRFDAERASRQACRAEVLAETGRDHRTQARTDHDRPAPRLPTGDPLDHRPQGLASHRRSTSTTTPRQSHRAVKQRYYPDAGLRELRVRVALL